MAIMNLFAEFVANGGAEGDRTPDLVIANDALSQLSYGPVPVLTRLAGQPRSGSLSEVPPFMKEQKCEGRRF